MGSGPLFSSIGSVAVYKIYIFKILAERICTRRLSLTRRLQKSTLNKLTSEQACAFKNYRSVNSWDEVVQSFSRPYFFFIAKYSEIYCRFQVIETCERFLTLQHRYTGLFKKTVGKDYFINC